MKPQEFNPQKRALMHKKASDQLRKKETWKNYEMSLRRSRTGYSEMDPDDEIYLS